MPSSPSPLALTPSLVLVPLVTVESVREWFVANQVLVVGIPLAYVLLLATSGVVVKAALRQAGVDTSTISDKRDTGSVVGKAENVLVLTFMLLEAYTALGVVFAAKSLVRRQDMDQSDTTYYLTGTITNFTYSIVFGLIVWQLFVA